MKALLIFLVAVSSVYTNRPYYNIRDAPLLFIKFTQDHHRIYKDVPDTLVHYDAFLKNLQKINAQNAKEPPDGPIHSINYMSDYTIEEIKNNFLHKTLDMKGRSIFRGTQERD